MGAGIGLRGQQETASEPGAGAGGRHGERGKSGDAARAPALQGRGADEDFGSFGLATGPLAGSR